MNFTHFVDTSQTLTQEQLPAFLHGLLMHQAGAQPLPGQAVLDLLIPIYCGNPGEIFDESKLGALAIQIKSFKDRNAWDLDSPKVELIAKGIFPEPMPVVRMMPELGIKTTPLKKIVRKSLKRQKSSVRLSLRTESSTSPTRLSRL